MVYSKLPKELPPDHPWLAQTPWYKHHWRNRNVFQNLLICFRNAVVIALGIIFFMLTIAVFVGLFGGFGETNGSGVNQNPHSPDYGKVEIAKKQH